MRDHPLTPMTDANLVRVMQAQTRRRVGLVHDVVARGPGRSARASARCGPGVGRWRWWMPSDDDLMRLGPALAAMPLVIVAGSGCRQLGCQDGPARARPAGRRRRSAIGCRRPGQRAVVSGSCSVATNGRWRGSSKRAVAFAIDPLAIAAGPGCRGRGAGGRSGRTWPAGRCAHATAEPARGRGGAAATRCRARRAGRADDVAHRHRAGGRRRQLVVAGGETPAAPWCRRWASAPDHRAADRSWHCRGRRFAELPAGAAASRRAPALKSGNFGGN